MIDRTPDAVLAYAISIGELTYCAEGGSTILVTVSDEVNIVIPASSTERAKYVDIDIDQIQGVSSGGGPAQFQSDSSQMESLVVLTIWFSNALEESFYVNALGQNARSINLAFTSSEAAATIQKILANRITIYPRASQSEPIDISQHLFGKINESVGTAPIKIFSGDLVTAANEASALLAQNPMGLLDLTQNAEDEFGYQLEQLDQSRVEGQSSHRTIMDSREPTILVDCAISPIDTKQFCEPVSNPPAKQHFQDLSNVEFQNCADRQEADSSPSRSPVAHSHRHFHVNGYNRLPTNASIEGPFIITEEHHGSSTCHADTCVDRFSRMQPGGPGFSPDKSVGVKTPKRAALVGPRRRLPILTRESKMQLTPPSMSIPVTPGSCINKRERHRAATIEAPQFSLKKPSRKAKVRRNKGAQVLSLEGGQKTQKDAKPLPSPISRPRRAAALSADKKIQDIIGSESSEQGEFESITSEAIVREAVGCIASEATENGEIESITSEAIEKGVVESITSEATEKEEVEVIKGEATASVRRNHKSDRHQNPSDSSGTNEGSNRELTSSKYKIIQSPGHEKHRGRPTSFTKATSRGLENETAGNSDEVDRIPDQLIQEASLVSPSSNDKPKLMPLAAPIHVVNQVDKAQGTMLTETSPKPLQEQDFIQRNLVLNSTVDVSGSFPEETTALSYEDVVNISRSPRKMEIPETPARESKHANAKDTNPHGISTNLSIAAKLQSALSSVIEMRPKANTRESPLLEAFQLSATIAPQPPKQAPEKNLLECENGDLFEANNNSNCKQRPLPLEARSDLLNRRVLQKITISDETSHVQALGNADCKHFEEFRTLDDDRENRSAKKHLKTPLDVDRKCKIISFGSKGPRNQGIPSSQKPRRVRVPRCLSPELSTSVKVTGVKRKCQGDNETETNPESHAGPPAKRPRKYEDVPRTRDSASRRGLKRDSNTKQNTREHSSHSTRVDANGSPLPFIHSRKINLAWPTIQTKPLRDVDNGYQNRAMHAHNLLKSKVGLLSPEAPPPPPNAQCIQAYQAAPNTVYDYAARKLRSRGISIDIQSHDVLEDARPLPFVDLYRDGLKNFMDMLQRSSKNPCEQDNSAIAATMNQDPEKTLVKAGHRQWQISSSVCSGASSSLRSSSPSSYSGDESPSDDPSSSDGGDDAGDELAAEFQPHQGKTLEVLYDISLVSYNYLVSRLDILTQKPQSVVRNLASKEKALKDLASDYHLGGNRLIEEFRKSRRRDILAYQIVIGSMKRNLAGVYKRTQQKLEEGLSASLKRELK